MFPLISMVRSEKLNNDPHLRFPHAGTTQEHHMWLPFGSPSNQGERRTVPFSRNTHSFRTQQHVTCVSNSFVRSSDTQSSAGGLKCSDWDRMDVSPLNPSPKWFVFFCFPLKRHQNAKWITQQWGREIMWQQTLRTPPSPPSLSGHASILSR